MKKETPAVEDFQTFRKKMIDWYHRHHRKLPWRESRNPYRIWVSEVMLQQTQVTTVIPYFENFIEKFPTVSDLAAADLQAVLKAWEGLGYYARARNLHKAAQVVSNHLAGEIPQDYSGFRKLPGVGEYIAAAVQSIAFEQPYPVVDGNVKRVLARLFQMEAPVNDSASTKIFQEIAATALDQQHPGEYNQAMMELGAMICRPQNPLCEQCPVSEFCRAYKSSRQDEFPRRKEREKTPQYHIAVGVVRKGKRLLITRRAENGLLGGLWEFPGGKVREGKETAAEACVREIKEEVNLEIKVESLLTTVHHAYTHFKIVMDVFLCDYLFGEVGLKGPVDYKWITVEEIEQYPFPKANHKFIPLLDNLTVSG
jgi:A/G-specific adenine glycosylase